MGEGIPAGAYPEYVHSCHLQTGMDILIPLFICEDTIGTTLNQHKDEQHCS